ncbi:MAG: rhomboid family intramembrane serine protease [Atopobiaceae bacterium]|jgi:GlpG protein|nr:rhomboid family intramembrane serine protease [Atopobiaceae bacterium]
MEAQPRKIRITLNAPVVLAFVALCAGATLLGQLTGGRATMTLFATYRSSLVNPLTYVRLFTHVLGHSGWMHLVSNLVYILLLGPLLEEKYGSRALAGIIAITALATGLVNAALFPRVALCGASGVCFAFILLSSLTSFREGEIPLTFILVALLFLGQEVVQGVMVQDDVSNLSHVIGGLIGAGMGFAQRDMGRRRA